MGHWKEGSTQDIAHIQQKAEDLVWMGGSSFSPLLLLSRASLHCIVSFSCFINRFVQTIVLSGTKSSKKYLVDIFMYWPVEQLQLLILDTLAVLERINDNVENIFAKWLQTKLEGSNCPFQFLRIAQWKWITATWKSGIGTPRTIVWQPPQTALVTVKPRNLQFDVL